MYFEILTFAVRYILTRIYLYIPKVLLVGVENMGDFVRILINLSNVLFRWQKPTRDRLLTHDYFRDYETEDRQSDNFVTVYRGLAAFPEVRDGSHSSSKGSMLSWLSLSSLRGKISPVYQPDEKSLLTDSHGGNTEDEGVELKDANDMA